AGRGRGRGADDVDAVAEVARDDVAEGGSQAADDVVRGVADADAVELVRRGGATGRVGADEVAGDHVAAGLGLDAVGVEVPERQPLGDRAGTGGPGQQAVGVGPGGRAVEVDQDFGVVAVGLRVHAGARLAVAVDDHALEDARQGDPGGAGVGADADGLHAGAGQVEVDGVV